jgi:GTPase SAR1 family protein
MEKQSASTTKLINEQGGKVYIIPELLTSVNNYVACLGAPGAGKSSFCNAFYKVKYGTNYEFFKASPGLLSFTKGMWVMTREAKMKIPNQTLDYEIIDVEGFQADYSKCWLYVMITSFLATDIILLNRAPRHDTAEKVLKIMKDLFPKMDKLGAPRILKTIFIQTKFREDLKENNYIDVILKDLKISRSDFPGITFKLFVIDEINSRNPNLLENRAYLEDIKNVINSLTPQGQSHSVASLMSNVENFNLALNGASSFDTNAIIQDIKLNFNHVYDSWQKKKENQLLSEESKKSLLPLKDTNESYESFISRQNINFTFNENKNEYQFHSGSESYKKVYADLATKKSFKVDSNIFREFYNLKKQELENKNSLIDQQCLNEKEEKKLKIDKTLHDIKFNGYISNYFDCSLNTKSSKKSEYENELKSYFEKKVQEKKNSFKDQIDRAKWRIALQAYGDMTCKGGNSLSSNVVHKNSGGNLFWVDGDTNTIICESCYLVHTIDSNLKCTRCGSASNCYLRLQSGYRP